MEDSEPEEELPRRGLEDPVKPPATRARRRRTAVAVAVWALCGVVALQATHRTTTDAAALELQREWPQPSPLARPASHESLKVLEDDDDDDDGPVNMPFPLPRRVSYGNRTLGLDAGAMTWEVERCAGGATCEDLARAVERYRSLLFEHRGATARACARGDCIATVRVSVDDVALGLDLGTDESYDLVVDKLGIGLSARTVYGAMHGLETLKQLTSFDFRTNRYEIRNADWAIHDAPQFAHRELLVDASRHFLPVAYLKDVVEALAMTRINVLHWHLVDDESFPWCSDAVPALCRLGAWSPEERYTRTDLLDLVSFARSRGVRIVPELHVPGHTASWCRGRPDACTDAAAILSPVDGEAQKLIATLLAEVRAIFPDALVHLGGSAVNSELWSSDPKTASFMKSHNATTEDVYADFLRAAIQAALELGQRPVVWDEAWDALKDGLDPAVVVHYASVPDALAASAAAGHHVLFSPAPLWDLGDVNVTYAETLVRQPCDHLKASPCELVLGGGGQLWTERVDGSNLFNTVWPRLAAIAERLWSAPDLDAARMKRARRFRCYLNRRGVPAASTLLTSSHQPPSGPGNCEDQ